VRTVAIVFLDPQGDAPPCVVEALALVDPDLLFFQAAVEALDVAVALGVVVGGAAVLDAEPAEGFDVAGRGELRAVVRGEGKSQSARAVGQVFEHGLLQSRESLAGAAAQAQIPADDLAREAVDDADQIRPAGGKGQPRPWSCRIARPDSVAAPPRGSSPSGARRDNLPAGPAGRARASPAARACLLTSISCLRCKRTRSRAR
jgi:hypothetical protein